MQTLSRADAGGIYTIQWMFGVPEILDFLRRNFIEEGKDIEVVSKNRDSLIVRAGQKVFAIGNEVADRIQVSL